MYEVTKAFEKFSNWHMHVFLVWKRFKNCDGLSIEGSSSSETGKEDSNQHYNSVLKRFHNKFFKLKNSAWNH